MSITSKRFTAYLLDIFFIYLLISLIINIKVINPTYEKYYDAYTKYSEVMEKYYNKDLNIEEVQEQNQENYYNVNKYSISNVVVIELVIFLYFCVFQKYNNGQTLGKKIMKIKVVSDNNEDVSILRYFLRILPMFFAFVGGFIPLLINAILVFILNSGNYGTVSSIITYVFIILAIFDVTMNLHNKISHTKIETV